MGIDEILQEWWLSENRIKILLNLSAHEKDEILRILKEDQDKRNREANLKPELIWNKEQILKDLENNHLIIEKDKEMEFAVYDKIVWNIFHLELPPVWNFNWYKCDFFIRLKDNNFSTISKTVFEEEDATLVNKRYSVSYMKIVELLKAINEYMKAYWVSMDEDIDFENDLIPRENNFKNKCETWNCLKRLFHLNGKYRQFLLREKGLHWSGDERSRVLLECSNDDFYFTIYYK